MGTLEIGDTLGDAGELARIVFPEKLEKVLKAAIVHTPVHLLVFPTELCQLHVTPRLSPSSRCLVIKPFSSRDLKACDVALGVLCPHLAISPDRTRFPLDISWEIDIKTKPSVGVMPSGKGGCDRLLRMRLVAAKSRCFNSSMDWSTQQTPFFLIFFTLNILASKIYHS